MPFIETLVERRRIRIVREFLLLVANLDIPKEVVIGKDFTVHHRGMGVVIHPKTVIGDRVTIFHQVTIGRADAYVPFTRSQMRGVLIDDDAVLCAGAKILGGPGVTRVGKGTIVAANAVLASSTGDWEIWGGVPARKIGDREPVG